MLTIPYLPAFLLALTIACVVVMRSRSALTKLACEVILVFAIGTVLVGVRLR
jgi:hypothetical protein